MRFFLLFLLFLPMSANGQDSLPPIQPTNMSGPVTVQGTDGPSEVQGDRFHGALVKAIRSAARKGEISRVDAVRLRVRLVSPAFREHVKTLAVTQMMSSEDADQLPRNAEGVIQTAQIDWDSIIAFLEKLIPLIQQLIAIFGG